MNAFRSSPEFFILTFFRFLPFGCSHKLCPTRNKQRHFHNHFLSRQALVNQHAAMEGLAKAKFQVAQHLAVMTKGTVLFETTGQTAGADRSTDSVNSYFSVQEDVANKTKMYADKYKQFIVDYAQEWYTTISDRVGADLKKAEKIRLELDHYQSKVESLRQSANATMAKGKTVDPKTAEKLTRNEDKLIKIKETSSKFINDLCLLMEEIVERSWRDLHPLLIKVSQFETQVSGDIAKANSSLDQIVSALKSIASEHGIKPQARLKDLGNLDPHVLSTRSKDDSRNLAIENGFSGLALGGSSFNGNATSPFAGNETDSYFPPGSTSAQGLGGFPVRVETGDTTSTYNVSTPSAAAAPSTMNMMNINAAPAPTFDTVNQAFGQNRSVPSSGGFYSTSASNHSSFTGAPAPPPSAAPPPPPPVGGGFDPFTSPAPAPQYGAPNMYGSGMYPQQQQQLPTQTPYSMGGAHTPQSMGGNSFVSPMPGGNFSQQPSMYPSQQQHVHSAPPSYGTNPTNPFG